MQEDNNDAYVVAVWLTDDPNQTKAYLPIAQESLQLQLTALTCYTGEKTGPEDWNLNDEAALTVVMAYKHRVVAALGCRSPTVTGVRAVQKALDKARAGSAERCGRSQRPK